MNTRVTHIEPFWLVMVLLPIVCQAQSGWFPQQCPTPHSCLWGVCFADVSTGIIAGETGILRTTDGGNSWNRPAGTAGIFKSVSFVDANNGTAVGQDGIVIHTTDGGATWTPQSSVPMKTLWGVSFSDANTGTAVGEGGTIIRTTNGGSDWIPQAGGTDQNLFCVCFIDASTGFVGGDDGVILRTTDGGTSWIKQSSGTTENLLGVHFIDASTGTAVGWNGTILRTTTGGVTWVVETNPSSAFLHLGQNYPNPVTTSTTIPFTLSKPEHVRLSVCDVLGREVVVLVDAERMVGEQSVPFNVVGLKAGIYFSVLKTGAGVETKKLLVRNHTIGL